MADTIVVQRGHIGTHKMHVYPGEIPNQVWAKIEAQNAGIVAGNWQNHLVCSPTSEMREVYNAEVNYNLSAQLTQWRVRWPRLGSYSRMSFWCFAGPADFDFTVRLWNAGYTTIFYHGTNNVEFENAETKRIVLEWDMEAAGLSAYLNDSIFIELRGKMTDWAGAPSPSAWTVYLNEFSIYTANRPL